MRRRGSPAKAGALPIGYFDAEIVRAARAFAPLTVQTRDQAMTIAQDALGAEEIGQQTAAGGAMTEEQILAVAFDNA